MASGSGTLGVSGPTQDLEQAATRFALLAAAETTEPPRVGGTAGCVRDLQLESVWYICGDADLGFPKGNALMACTPSHVPGGIHLSEPWGCRDTPVRARLFAPAAETAASPGTSMAPRRFQDPSAEDVVNDAHAHVFPTVAGRTGSGPTQSLAFGRIRHGGGVQQLLSPQNAQTRYPVEMLVANLDALGIERAMLLQGPFYGTTNEYQAAALAAFPDRLWGALRFDPWSDPPDLLTKLVEPDRYRALKLECSVPTGLAGLHPELALDAPDLDWIWRLLAARNLTLTLDLGKPGTASYQTDGVGRIARRHPDLRILIAHLGQPDVSCLQPGPRRDLWHGQLELGTLPNVWFDCAALPVYFPDEEYPQPSAVACMREAFRLLGSDKILWGTDQPGVLHQLPLRYLIRLARHCAVDLDEEGWRRFTAGNFHDVYGLR